MIWVVTSAKMLLKLYREVLLFSIGAVYGLQECSYNAKNIKALSWTLDRETAEWFAHRFGEEGTVYEAQIPKKYILAFFNGRNESEVVVDPKHLEQIMESPEPEMGMRMT